MSYSALIQLAPIWTYQRHTDPAWNRPGRSLYEAGALKFAPAVTEIPLLVDHEDDQRIGTVHELVRIEWLDGPWLCARATVDEAPGWLRTRTKASFGFIAHNTRTYSEGDLIAGALVREITVLSPGRKPAEPCAEVLLLRQVSPATEATSDLAVAGENLRDPTGAVLRRPGIGQVLGIR